MNVSSCWNLHIYWMGLRKKFSENSGEKCIGIFHSELLRAIYCASCIWHALFWIFPILGRSWFVIDITRKKLKIEYDTRDIFFKRSLFTLRVGFTCLSWENVYANWEERMHIARKRSSKIWTQRFLKVRTSFGYVLCCWNTFFCRSDLVSDLGVLREARS